ncbi:MAG: hypothetical protein EA409_01620 [Saprospirales bacterium]|nr:MAG: hypothetical protein EA409_01620 [Saprospirales bacterium]
MVNKSYRFPLFGPQKKINLLKQCAVLAVMLSFFSCTVDVFPKMMSSDRPSGEMTFIYEHRDYEKPRLHWETAMEQARERCLEWGYTGGVRKYDAGEKECISPRESGCGLWQIKHRLYCYE